MVEAVTEPRAAQRFINSLRAYTVAQFAEVYQVGRTRVFEEIASGRLKSYRAGRRRYISAAAAEEWQRAREAEEANG